MWTVDPEVGSRRVTTRAWWFWGAGTWPPYFGAPVCSSRVRTTTATTATATATTANFWSVSGLEAGQAHRKLDDGAAPFAASAML